MRCRDLATGTWTEGPSDPGWAVDAVAWGELVWVGLRGGWGGPGVEPGLVAVDPRTCARVDAVPLLLEPYALALRSATTEGDSSLP